MLTMTMQNCIWLSRTNLYAPEFFKNKNWHEVNEVKGVGSIGRVRDESKAAIHPIWQ